MMLQKSQSRRTVLLKYGLSAPLFMLMLILSAATVSKNNTAKLINKKVEQVLLLPSSLNNTNGALNTKSLTPPVASEVKKVALVPNTDTIPAENEKIFTSVEKEPEFKGGIGEFFKFLATNIHYPEAMKKNNIQGKVFVTFVVLKDGSISNVKVVRGIGYGADEETVRVIRLSPKWNPGMQNGRPVNVQYTVPVNFALADKKTAIDTAKNSNKNTRKNSFVFVGKQNTFGKYNQSALYNIDHAVPQQRP